MKNPQKNQKSPTGLGFYKNLGFFNPVINQ